MSRAVSLTRSTPGAADPVRADPAAFSLKDRALGEDVALNALSMVGLKRLDNIEACVTAIVKEGVAGDLIETGCAKGGSCILMKAVLRAHKDRERKVVCCDTFAGSKPPPPPAVALLLRPLWALVWLLAWVPSYAWHRKLYAALMRMQHSFPVDMEHTSSDTIRSFLFYVRNGHRFAQPTGAVTGTGLDDVKSHFARLGLLDDRVLFLKGFFAETLPAAPVRRSRSSASTATSTSTVDALVALYPAAARRLLHRRRLLPVRGVPPGDRRVPRRARHRRRARPHRQLLGVLAPRERRARTTPFSTSHHRGAARGGDVLLMLARMLRDADVVAGAKKSTAATIR